VPTYLLTIAYEGTRYAGWQRQADRDTVQGRLEEAFAAIDRPGVHVEAAGRTDAGVHALGQCAHVVLERPFPVDRLHLALNANLPPDIAVQRVELVEDGFHARFCAQGKRYVYRCVVSPVRPAIGRALFHWVRRPVDLGAMRAAAAPFVGRHDFASFATNPGYHRPRGTVRTVQRAHLLARPHGFDFAVQGSGFLYNMVRTMIGSLLEVGVGNRAPEWIGEVLRARDRRRAAATAPAQGLYLLRVLYAPDRSPAAEPGIGDED
jgi:tRNA pseudouridine38-40 synthase